MEYPNYSEVARKYSTNKLGFTGLCTQANYFALKPKIVIKIKLVHIFRYLKHFHPNCAKSSKFLQESFISRSSLCTQTRES